MFFSLTLLSGVLLLLGRFVIEDFHSRILSLVILNYCAAMILVPYLTPPLYVLSSVVLITCSLYHIYFSKNKVRSLVFITPPLILKFWEILIVIGSTNILPEIFIDSLFNVDYLFISSLLFLLVLENTDFNLYDLEIKSFRELIILITYVLCVGNIII